MFPCKLLDTPPFLFLISFIWTCLSFWSRVRHRENVQSTLMRVIATLQLFFSNYLDPSCYRSKIFFKQTWMTICKSLLFLPLSFPVLLIISLKTIFLLCMNFRPFFVLKYKWNKVLSRAIFSFRRLNSHEKRRLFMLISNCNTAILISLPYDHLLLQR
jgi:hypothetical protein